MNQPTSKLPRFALLLCAVLAIVCVVLAVLNSRERSNLSSLKEETTVLRAQLEETQRRLESQRTAAREASAESTEADARSAAGPAAPAGGQDPGARSERKRNLDPQGMSALMKSPVMKQLMASQTSTIMQITYGHLMDHFGLTPEERDYMHRLLVEKQTNLQTLGMQMMNPALSDEERAGIRTKLEEAWKSGEDRIREFLNDDVDFAYYQTYTKQEPERREVAMFQSSLEGDDAIDPATSDALARLQNEARKKFPFSVDFYDQSNFGNSAVLTTTAVDRFIEEQTKFQEQVAGEAAHLLTPTQLEAFKNNQTAVRQMTGMQLNSIVQMAGGRK